jgi:hypothetical protein
LEHCKNTGLSIPECSCRACLMRLIGRHAPELLAGVGPHPARPRLRVTPRASAASASAHGHRDAA